MRSRCFGVMLFVLALAWAWAPCYAVAYPPLCPHVIGWNSEINTWAQGAPWIKVIFPQDIAPAKATGAKVMYRPFTADTVYWENGYLPTQRTGATYADLVWAQVSGLAIKPEAITYRNEFDWANTYMAKRTCAEFVNYKNRLRELGYTGKVIFGSFSPDWVTASTWQDPDLMAAVNASDGVETHEYFDFLVNCCLPNRCFRHRDIAIANNPYLQGKDWYIGEFGSDVDHGPCSYCGDGQWRTGWRDRGKLTEQQYIDQMKIYRAGCSPQVVAVFVFQQGDQTSWSNYEVVGTSVATYMKTTWTPLSGSISGTVHGPNQLKLTGATITLSPGGYTTVSNEGGFQLTTVPAGTYAIKAAMAGYASQVVSGVTLEPGGAANAAFTLTPLRALSSVKALANNETVAVSGIVTARLLASNGAQTAFYVEAEDRSCAIRVTTPLTANVGDRVDVAGTMATTPGRERYIAATSVAVIGTGVIEPLLVTTDSVGGNSLPYNAATGSGQSATRAWRWAKTSQTSFARSMSDVQGLNNLGLLVRLAGKVTGRGIGYFYLDDGTGWDDFEQPSGSTKPSGLRVILPPNVSPPFAGSFVIVTGVCSCYRPGDGHTYRMLQTWRADNVVTVLP